MALHGTRKEVLARAGRHLDISGIPEEPMRTYARFSGLFFTVLALVQLTRLVLRWPVQVAGVAIPVWISGVAFLILGSLAIWAFRADAASNTGISR
jgi:hypothetical protein